jgi:hypothetical protein
VQNSVAKELAGFRHVVTPPRASGLPGASGK